VIGAAAPYFLAAALIASGAAYLKGRQDGKAIAAAQEARDERVAVIAAESAASAAAVAIRQIRITNTTIQQRLEREIQTRVQYVDCRHAPGVLDTINEALTGQRPKPPAGGGVPAVDAPGR
jgi:hypothetical protein